MQTRYAGGLPKSFLQPCLLLLLKEEEDHGYGLVARLKTLGIDDDAATVYRALRVLEGSLALRSFWQTGAAGPARRVYSLTPTGEEMLDEWAAALQDTAGALRAYLMRHSQARAGPAEADQTTVRRLGIAPPLRSRPGPGR